LIWEAEVAFRRTRSRRVEQLAQQIITADPQQREVVKRLADTPKRADMSKVPPQFRRWCAGGSATS
jgi:hypothetical protein